MPLAAFEDLNQAQAEAGERLFVEPAQRRRRGGAAEGPRGHGHAPAVDLGLPGGLPPRRAGFRQPRREPGLAAGRRAPGQPRVAALPRPGGGAGLRAPRRGGPSQPSLPDRRGGGEGRFPGRAAGTGVHRSQPPLGHRLQVPARGGDHPPLVHRGERGAHRGGDPLRRPRAGLRGRAPPSPTPRCTTRTRSPARTCGSATSSSSAGRGRSSPKWWGRCRRCAPGPRRCGPCPPNAPSAAAPSRGAPARRWPAAPAASPAPPGCGSTWRISPGGAAWTSRAWATRPSTCCCARASSPTRPTCSRWARTT